MHRSIILPSTVKCSCLTDSHCLMHSAPFLCMGVKKNGHGCHGDKCNWCTQYLRTCLDSSLPQLEFTAPRHKSAMPCWYTLLASSTNCFQPVNTPWSPENLSSRMLSQSPFLIFYSFFSAHRCTSFTLGWHAWLSSLRKWTEQLILLTFVKA